MAQRGHAALDLVARHRAPAQAEGKVVLHAHVRIERVGLEHHRDVAVLGRHPLTVRPSIDSVPDEIDSSPAIMRSVVVLPQPEGPSSTMNSPCRTSSD